MKTTYRYLAYSIIESMKISVDDAELKRNTIIFWIQVTANQLRQERLAKRKLQSGEYMAHFSGIIVNSDGKRKYCDMPSDIVDLIGDNGIAQATYVLDDVDYCNSAMDVPFEKTSPAKIWSLNAIGIRKPAPNRPFMAREGPRLYLYGIQQVFVDTIELWLYTQIDPKRVVDIDSEIELAADLIPVLMYKVMSLAKFGLLVSTDLLNDGANASEQKNKTALSQTTFGEQPQQQQQPEQ